MRRGIVGAIALGAMLVPGAAHAVEYAPPDRSGPALSVPQSELDASLECSDGLAGAGRAPVLLIHGTGSTPHHNFSWNYVPALDALGIPWCTVALLGHGMADIQESGEYVVNAIRTMHERSGRRIAILGHSQGGMIGRWALRFWPDTRAMVDDLVGFAPSNHGSDGGDFVCNTGCSPAFWQQSSSSEFIKALNSFQETFAGVSYTVIYTHTDWVVTPNSDDSGSSSLHTGDGEITNVAIQDICPADLNEHLQIGTVDAVAYALAIDALDHPGPADESRIDSSVCLEPLQPGVDPVTGPASSAAAAADLANTTATYPHVDVEPPLKCYVLAAGCPAQASIPISASAPAPAGPAKKKHKKKQKKKKKKRRHAR
jgi:pimeloyl-ACP methyl ester carboxylesterase